MLVMVSCHPELFAVSLPNGRRTNHDKLSYQSALRQAQGDNRGHHPMDVNQIFLEFSN
ncbi:MAG: hypothetical protein IEMM0002_1085 [bacterium]|nr:MAG: hypothetical protein IEMM0002_1085 [bacterium]